MDHAKEIGQTEISLEAFDQIVSFIKRSGESKLTLVGGEPTMHRYFSTIMERLDSDPEIRQVLLFTNGIINKSSMDAILNHSRKVLISVNVLEPGDEPDCNKEQILRNLHKLRDAEIPFDLSYVIYKRDFNPDFLYEYIEKYDLESIRWALAFPVVPEASFVPSNEIRSLGSKVTAMLRRFSDFGIRSYVDCPLPYCLFSDEELAFVSREALSVINWGYCGLTLEINPDLTVKACPTQCEEERISLSLFRNMKEMERYFFSRMTLYKAKHQLFDECSTCSYFLKQSCQGGCLGYSSDRYVPSPLPMNFLNELQPATPDTWVHPIPHLELQEKNSAYYIYSTASHQVEPEEISAKEKEIWVNLANGALVEALENNAPEHGITQPFLARLHRIGFVDIVQAQ